MHKKNSIGKYCSVPIIERFWEKVDKKGEDECWEWLASKNHASGTMFAWDNKYWTAHKISYKLFIGEIPKGLCILHRCDNPLCVNPKHLFLGTHQDNMNDMAIKGRAYGTRLKKQNIKEIFRLHALGEPQHKIGKLFGVCQQYISKILRKKVWKHVVIEAADITKEENNVG